MSDEPELETFLRRFRPCAPTPLPQRRRRSLRAWGVVAVAAAVLITLTWWGRSTQAPEPLPAPAVSSRSLPATLGGFRLAVRGGTYGDALDRLDGVLLPDPTRRGGALHSLADVSRDR